MNTLELIGKYIEDKRLAWSKTTIDSEFKRLNGLASVLDGNPLTLWSELERRKIAPYSRLTTWTRVVHYWQFLLDNGLKDGTNEYKKFKEKNSRQFKNVYERKTTDITFEEAKKRINTINPEVRECATRLLMGGLRFSESSQVNNGDVVGKGGKRRKVFVENSNKFNTPNYSKVRRELAKVGLKPHTLRKIFATELVKKGADVFELLKAMGWSKLETAQSYINVNNKSLEDKVREIHEGIEVSKCIQNSSRNR